MEPAWWSCGLKEAGVCQQLCPCLDKSAPLFHGSRLGVIGPSPGTFGSVKTFFGWALGGGVLEVFPGQMPQRCQHLTMHSAAPKPESDPCPTACGTEAEKPVVTPRKLPKAGVIVISI